MSRYSAWTRRLSGIRTAGRERTLRTLTPTSATTALLDQREVIVAASNDYLGLAWALRDAPHRPGGSGSSRLLTGTRRIHVELEHELGEWLGADVLLFNSGYHANLAVFSTVTGPDQHVASDALNHASIIDGLRLGRARKTVTPHARPDAIPTDADLVVVEGLYSMDGDTPDLTAYPSGPWLAVDDAHAIGCRGPDGRGTAAAQGVDPDILIGTFGKAFGAAGAFVAGPPELTQLLVNAGRSFIYTTAMPESVAAAVLMSLRWVRERPELRDRLITNSTWLRSALRDQGWSVLGDAHIVPVLTGADTMGVADRLLAQGVLAPGIRYPTVAAGSERIRLTVSAAHTPTQLHRIADAFGEAPG